MLSLIVDKLYPPESSQTVAPEPVFLPLAVLTSGASCSANLGGAVCVAGRQAATVALTQRPVPPGTVPIWKTEMSPDVAECPSGSKTSPA